MAVAPHEWGCPLDDTSKMVLRQPNSRPLNWKSNLSPFSIFLSKKLQTLWNEGSCFYGNLSVVIEINAVWSLLAV